MEGATVMGGPAERCRQALAAGCDMLLLCNNRQSTIEAIDGLSITEVPQAASLAKRQSFSVKELKATEKWKTSASELKPTMLNGKNVRRSRRFE